MTSRDPFAGDILLLARRGVRPGEIAMRLGLSRQRVYMRIGYLRRTGEDIPTFPRGPLPGSKTRRLRLSRLPHDVTDRLSSLAEARGQTTGQFATRLLTVITRDDLVGAILDDTEGQS